MKFQKKDILWVSFLEFLFNGYNSPIISALQKKLGMSRGAVYRHYKDKNDLFRAVIEKYFFKMHIQLLNNIDPDIKALQLIEHLHRKLQLFFLFSQREGLTQAIYLRYTGLLSQASKYYPDFLHNYKEVKIYIASYWEKALIKSIEANEIKSDTDLQVMSTLFTDIYMKDNKEYEVDAIFFHNMKNGLDEKTRLLLYLYDLIKLR